MGKTLCYSIDAHRQPILHMSKIMVHCYYKDETINQFSIGYMINP